MGSFTPKLVLVATDFSKPAAHVVQHSECPVLVVSASAVREQEVPAGVGCACDA
jgi:ribosomal protein L18E